MLFCLGDGKQGRRRDRGWDLGWKVGHASRNSKEVIEECRKEIQSKNAILESRLICGSDTLYKSMRKKCN